VIESPGVQTDRAVWPNHSADIPITRHLGSRDQENHHKPYGQIAAILWLREGHADHTTRRQRKRDTSASLARALIHSRCPLANNFRLRIFPLKRFSEGALLLLLLLLLLLWLLKTGSH
jgi:hypothetical protein